MPMRRLVQHALAGAGITALAVGAALSGAGAPAGSGATIAVPAPAVSISATGSTDPVSAAIEAERLARQTDEDRSAARERLTASAVAQAVKRSAALQDESRSIGRQQAQIVADREVAAAAARAKQQKARAAAKRAEAEVAKARAATAAATKAAEAKAAQARRKEIAAQGYEPGTTDPRDIARQILQNKYGYGADQYSCFNNIIIRESNWVIDATNAASGAYGIPQALPGSKMASVASDWRTNPATQITWAIGYMKDRYGSPCGAWGFKSSHGWY
jgi:hypothetical protein